LSITGGGRCNITNAEYNNRILLVNYGEAEKFLYSTFSRFAVEQTFSFFEARGLPLVVEARKRAFPKTLKATDVTRVMIEYMQAHQVQVRTQTAVRAVLTDQGRVLGIDTDCGAFKADHVILATGGLSHSDTGATGDGFKWLRDLGHTVHDPNPDVVPLAVAEAWVKKLSGTSLANMTITFFEPQTGAQSPKRIRAFSRTGEILFTHFGLSGPLILNSAHDVKTLLKQGSVMADIDLFPEMTVPEVDRAVLEVFAKNGNKLVRTVLKAICPAGMASALTDLLDHALLEKKISHVTQDERKSMVQLLKGLPLTVTGTMGYDWAVISDGGVPLTEIDTRTMASRLHPNLYIIGDLLDINRPSGGYSLQLCWTTGWVAGSHV
ncbi:MAG: aminoacetone oxidase family FAD-binding enzyme, partial [Phycisphaerae bacterium]|nr:aminoacetone oxidase family FAD-binding enzyme [Phycisphaerae bacterium]